MSLLQRAALISALPVVMMVLMMQHALAGTAGDHNVKPETPVWKGPMPVVIDVKGENSVSWMHWLLDANPEYDHRDPLITLYQATQSISFQPGFETADGDAFIAEIVSYSSQVPPPSNNTGNPNNNIHWIISKSFDENGNVISESKQFFDNNGGILQSQDKIKYRKDAGTTFTHVFANEPIRDVFGRIAATTMSAPLDNSEFSYKPEFLSNPSNGTYNYTNFDRYGPANAETDKSNNPDPVGGQHLQGTLGWYYSNNNTWEPYTPTTNYPYKRQVFYKDGTGNTKKTAGAGEAFRAGSGHEIGSYTMPVINELSHYIQVRNRFFTSAELGAVPDTLKYRAMQTISKDPNGRLGILIQSKEGNTLMSGRPGNDLSVSNSATVLPGTVFYFRTFAPGNITISSGTNGFYNMETEQPVNIGTGGTIAEGYYKLVNTGANDITISYNNSYTDVSYSFYNQVGKLVATIAPEGVKKLYGSGINNYAAKNDVPFITLYEYDVKGQLIKTTSTDGGASEMVYRKDGKIRFSQNAGQKITGRYSYTNYDALSRAIESGEYQPDGSGIQFNSDLLATTNPMRDILENTSSTGGLTTGTKTDVVLTLFDAPDNSHGQSNYVQDLIYLGNAVSMSRKYSSIVNNTPNSADIVSSTWYNYDEEGKVLWMIQYIKDLGYKTTDYTYDALGRLTKKVFQKYTGGETFVHYYEHDPVTRMLWKVYTNTADDINTRQLQATYIYYLHGPLKRIELGGDLQGIDYTYTLQGALKAINNSDKTKDPASDGNNGVSADAFGMVLDYYPGDYVNNRSGIQPIKGVNSSAIGTDSYAGNIKAMTWFSKKPASVSGTPGIEDPTTYVFQYDDKYQFTESTWGTAINFSNTPATFTATALNKETIKHPSNNTPAYDANGNILHLQRTDISGVPGDRFTYNYVNNTNKLQSITNDANGTPYASYTYNNMGQLTAENTGGANSKHIKYDVNGRVVIVARDGDFVNKKVVEYVYNELGQRIIKKSYNTSFQLSQITYYTNEVIYTQPVTAGTPGNITAEEYEIEIGGSRLGVYYRQSGIYAYELQDQTGNIRAVVAKSGSTMEVRVYTDYYPYGMAIRKAGDYRYGYQGEYAEKDPETDWNAFELRMYDSRIGRWLTMDPQGEYWSPYVAMGNDPVSKSDPSGGCTDCPDSRKWEDRSKLWIDKNGSRWEATDDGWKQIMDQVIVRNTKTPSWGYANIQNPVSLYYRFFGPESMEVSNLTEQTLASISSIRRAILTGGLLEGLKNDPEMLKRMNELVQEAKQRMVGNAGKDDEFTRSKVIGFGGEIGGSRDWDRLDWDHPTLHWETYQVAANKLTWSVRNATITSVVSVHDNGRFIHIQHFLKDYWDLSPQAGRSKLYDAISWTGGVYYHYLFGGNSNMQVTASWSEDIWLLK